MNPVLLSVVVIASMMCLAAQQKAVSTYSFTSAFGLTLVGAVVYPEAFELTPMSIPLMILHFAVSLGCSLYCFENPSSKP